MASDRHATPTEWFEFSWWRREKGPGFRWEQGSTGLWLLVGPPNKSLLPYEPLVQETGLFLTFAHLDGSNDEFLGFANTYGRLGSYHSYSPDHREPLDEWRRHHRWMRFLAKLQNDCALAKLQNDCANEGPELREVVTWKGDEVIYRFPKIGTGSTELWRHRGELRLRPQSKKGLLLFRPGE